jgi:5,10-methylenetetrahydromethanopterin reductase
VSPERELGLGLQTDKPLAEYGRLAQAAEDAGFDVVTTFNDLWFQPALPALLEIARATERVRVGPSCLNPFTVHPVEIAGQVAMLDAASDGRAFLGLARGAWVESLGVDQSEPVTAMRDAWEIVSRLLAGDDSAFSGERFSLPQGSRLRYERRRSTVPLLVGTWSPRLAAFAGEAAQELKIGGSANPAVVPEMRERIGNDDVRIVLGAVTVVDEDGERARAIARREVAMYLGVVAELDPTFALDPDLLLRVRDGDGTDIADDVLDRFAFAGTPAEVAEHAEAVFEAGAGRIDFGTPHGEPERHGVELLCAQVLPRLR